MKYALIVTLLCLAGCGGKPAGPPTAPVRGSVTLDGKPLAAGEIYFWTVSEGRYEIVPIVQGAFSGTVTVGERRIEIYSYKPGPKLTGPGEGGVGPPVNTLPARYSTSSNLTATVLETADNAFEFKLQSN